MSEQGVGFFAVSNANADSSDSSVIGEKSLSNLRPPSVDSFGATFGIFESGANQINKAGFNSFNFSIGQEKFSQPLNAGSALLAQVLSVGQSQSGKENNEKLHGE